MSYPVDAFPTQWPSADLTFAERELGLEFPSTPVERISQAVNSAATFIPPDRGRVQLLRKARELLRT